jgi:hypothetical protein
MQLRRVRGGVGRGGGGGGGGGGVAGGGACRGGVGRTDGALVLLKAAPFHLFKAVSGLTQKNVGE